MLVVARERRQAAAARQRQKDPARGKKARKLKKILNSGNEPKDLLQRKELAFFGAKNELVFECKRTQKRGQKTAFCVESKSNSRVQRRRRLGERKGGYMSLRIRGRRVLEMRRGVMGLRPTQRDENRSRPCAGGATSARKKVDSRFRGIEAQCPIPKLTLVTATCRSIVPLPVWRAGAIMYFILDGS